MSLSPDERVSMLQRYIENGGHDSDMIASLLRDVLDGGSWTEFKSPVGFTHHHESFRSFVETDRWEGLGTTKDALVAWVKVADPGLAKRVEAEWKREIPSANVNGGSRKANQPRDTRLMTPAAGSDTSERVLSRLKRDDPDLAEKVVNGEITANAAAVRKGWRKPRIVLTSPEAVARQLREHMEADAIRELAHLLQADL